MKKISEPSRKRLVELAQILRHVKSKRITSVQLEQMTGWSNASIRKDISSLGYIGGVSNGYEVSELLEQICLTLNIAKDDEDSKNRGILHKCCIVGLAKLGAALLENSIFYNSGFSVIAGFDSNVNRTEILSASFPLYPASKMNVVIPQSQIEYAILTVSAETAQSMADRLVLSGIKGIVNMTNIILSVPQNIKVINLSVVNSLMELSVGTQPVK